jgi:hypothetical protein
MFFLRAEPFFRGGSDAMIVAPRGTFAKAIQMKTLL